MKSILKVALLATTLMAAPAFAADMSDDMPSKPMYKKHKYNDSSMKDDMHRGYRDANGKWHPANDRMARGYRDADGNWHEGRSDAMRTDGRTHVYNEYNGRTGQGRWMGINFESRHMSDGSDTDQNNRGRHAYIFDDGKNAQDFRVGSGHVVKF